MVPTGPAFEGAERVLDQGAALAHDARLGLHPLAMGARHGLMFIAPDFPVGGFGRQAPVFLAQARDCYRRAYWEPAHCAQLPWPLAALVFDAAVNQGLDIAVRMLQKSAGIKQDGILGTRTLTAIGAADHGELCALYLVDRALRYIGTRNFDRFGRGWFKRLFHIAQASTIKGPYRE